METQDIIKTIQNSAASCLSNQDMLVCEYRHAAREVICRPANPNYYFIPSVWLEELIAYAKEHGFEYYVRSSETTTGRIEFVFVIEKF